MKAVTSDGVKIAVHDLGGGGEPALLLHGAGFCAALFEPIAKDLGHRFRLFAPDFRGHGVSDRPDPPHYPWTAFVDDILTTIDALGIDQPVGIGHSLGGAAIMLTELCRRGTFSSLYCFEPPMLSSSQTDLATVSEMSAMTRKRRSDFPSREAVIEYLHGRGAYAELSSEALSLYAKHALTEQQGGTFRLTLDPTDEAAIYENAPVDRFSELAQVICPVVVAYGSLSKGPGPGFSRVVSKHLPGARLEEVPGVGHLGPIACPETVARSIIHATE